MFELMEHQKDAVSQLGNGKVLYGEVGVGKSITALAYYVQQEAGRDVFVITTAKKRDSLDWESDAAKFGIGRAGSPSLHGSITVDSWNNIGKYVDAAIDGAFFIFDEQRVVGTGAWVKSFIKIARRNHWILLSATPGDTWLDYAPLFVANGWYKNLTQFKQEHVVYAPYVKFPKVIRYVNTARLEALRNEILVEMPYLKHTTRIMNLLECGYDHELMDMAVKRRWHPYENRPIWDVGELFRVMRKISNSDPSRIEYVRMLLKVHPKLIVFYNFDYELAILEGLQDETLVLQWNGHQKDNLVNRGEKWVYLVQYQAGAEGWNCTQTDAMCMYSYPYSYKNFIQAQGRIDRLDTKFRELYYYILASDSTIDRSIKKALDAKKSFNEAGFAQKWLK